MPRVSSTDQIGRIGSSIRRRTEKPVISSLPRKYFRTVTPAASSSALSSSTTRCSPDGLLLWWELCTSRTRTWLLLLRPDSGGRRLAARPVSYTHLRAHETRHDLVCRL